MVEDTAEVAGGQSSDLTTVLRFDCGQRVFLKGVHGRSRRMRWLRNEITASTLAPGIAPRVLFHADIDGWLVVAFEHIAGRAASLAPGSADLPLVAETVQRIGSIAAPNLRSLSERWNQADWWSKTAAEEPELVRDWDTVEMDRWSAMVPDLVDGERLLHTDLHGEQFLIDSGTVHVVDWGFPGRGALWVDTAFLLLRLIDAGHHPTEAEAWAWEQSTSAGLIEHTLTAFAAYLAGMWSYWAATSAAPGTLYRAQLARDYVSWRLRENG
ncbi:hypothetical protein BC739_001445 [Kutzneria viridogrisea]|uniref:Aminoglycoside phosphotransferase domain-containing protein n=1 Tax=Kutzneria viridogrisea TaxID=47990 RepID=A0ABR6BBJ7_9PSEU|nr:hypothetical protein [Kutzneria viridogrisea]